MKKSTLYIGAAFAIGAVGALWWLKRGLQESGGESTRGVTSTAKSSNVTKDAVVTTPIHDPGFVAPATTLSLLPKTVLSVFDRVRGFVLPAAPSAKAQPFGNVLSARAAYTAPIRPEYKPTSYGIYNRSNVQ